MPVEVIGRFNRRGGVYLTGESVDCEITIRNIPGGEESQQDFTGKDGVEVIQWCSAQIHCQEVINTHRVKLVKQPEHQLTQGDVANGSTSFLATRGSQFTFSFLEYDMLIQYLFLGENGCAIYASKPTILCCNLELSPGQEKTYHYSETLPRDNIPPSFKGMALKYLYKLTIGVQHVDTPVKLLRIPFRVLTLPGLADPRLHATNLSAGRSDPQHHPFIDIANELIETMTAGKSHHSYNVTDEVGKVCTLTLPKKAFKLGEDIVGIFDFTQAASACSQFLVSLQTEEGTLEEYLLVKDQRPLVTTHATQHGFCLYYSTCELRIQIPLNATPTFSSDLVNVRWNLHFEFVIADEVKGSYARHPDGGVEWTAPSSLNVHTMVWDLPIKVYACNPLHAANAAATADAAGSLIRAHSLRI